MSTVVRIIIIFGLAASVFPSLHPFGYTFQTLGIALALGILILAFIWSKRAAISTNTAKQLNPLWYAVFIGSITLVGFGLRLYNAGSFEFFVDEYQGIAAAYSFTKTGDFYKWDWLHDLPGNLTDCIETDRSCHYTRAWPFTVFVSLSFKLLGVSELSARLPAILFGTALIPMAYVFVSYVTKSKSAGLLAAALIAINPQLIEASRFVRMYSMLWFVHLAGLYFFVRWVDLLREAGKKQFLNKYLVAACFLFLVSYLTHVLTLVTGIGIALWFMYMAMMSGEKSRRWYIGLISAGVLGVVAIFIIQSLTDITIIHTRFITVLDQPHIRYSYLLTEPIYRSLAGVLVLTGLAALYVSKKRKAILHYTLLLTSIVAGGLVYFVYFADRYVHYLYLSNTHVLFLILLGICLYYLSRFMTPAIAVLIVAVFGLAWWDHTGFLYQRDNNYGRYAQAYTEIREQYQPDEVIMAQFGRTYYMRSSNIIGQTTYVDMLRQKQFTYEQFLDAIEKHPKGWITWETRETEANIDPQVKEHICTNFDHLHGRTCGKVVDDTNVEVFYYDLE